MTDKSWDRLKALKSGKRKTARARVIKTHAKCLWDLQVRAWARRAWFNWYRRAICSRLAPFRRVARTIEAHHEGFLTAVATEEPNASA